MPTSNSNSGSRRLISLLLYSPNNNRPWRDPSSFGTRQNTTAEKLINVQIQNFRCIDDTTPFSINQTTCLVGKNESGKTAILQAIERLMSYDGGRRQYNKLQDYPRRYYSDYASRHPAEEALVLTTEWLLETADLQVLEEEFGPAC